MASDSLHRQQQQFDQLINDLNGLVTTDSLTAVWNSNEKLIISLDFGTTFSGISYSFANKPGSEVDAILNWPGAEGHSVPKIPTVISYDPKDKKSFTWGASAVSTNDCVVGVKLLLDPSQKRPPYLPDEYILKDRTKLPKDPVEIAADFMRAAYEHALVEIGKGITDSYLQICQKQFVLSVPAVWSDAAKNATQQAAKMAGIFPVTLIKEPEAAALYTINSLKFAVSVKDTFVLCDAGGGTVDLISYEVVGQNPLQLKELVPGTGGMAGSLGLNHRFAEAVKNLIGKKRWEEFRGSEAFLHAERSFEEDVKRKFQGRGNESFYINFPMASLPDNPAAGLKSNCWKITGTQLKEIFEPLVVDILRLIEEQVSAVKIKKAGQPLTGIFLVGGFGSNQYLKRRVEMQFPSIKLLQPPDAWGAIVKGATLNNLPRIASVVSTCATRHYGVEAWDIYDPAVDGNVPTRKWRDGSTKAESMTWYINIGEDLFREQVIRFSFFRTLEEKYTPDNLIFEEILYECQDSEAPRNRCKGNVIQNCKLVTDLRSLSKSKFVKTEDSTGKSYYKIHYEIVVAIRSALMTFSIEIDKKPFGSIGVDFK